MNSREIELTDEEFLLNNIPEKIESDFTTKILELERITAIVKCIFSAKEKIKNPYIRMVLDFTFEGYNLDEIFILLDGSYSKKTLNKYKNQGFHLLRESCKHTYESWI